MFTVKIVFTGLIFFAQAPTDPKFTNAVLVTGMLDQKEHHNPKLMIKSGSVQVTKNGKPDSTREWKQLGGKSMVTFGDLTDQSAPPKRLERFISHVPSIGEALRATSLKERTALPCTYAAMPQECPAQQGRIRLSGGELDAVLPTKDPSYPFLNLAGHGDYSSHLTATTFWTGTVDKITIIDDGGTYEVTGTGSVEIEVSNHPNVEGYHFMVFRHLYSATNDAEQFAEPIDVGAFFRRFNAPGNKGRDEQKRPLLMTTYRPLLCPPAVQ